MLRLYCNMVFELHGWKNFRHAAATGHSKRSLNPGTPLQWVLKACTFGSILIAIVIVNALTHTWND